MTRRLPKGGQIDRSKPLEFTFNGKTYKGYDGDSLTSALIANGVQITARSFKYHRPRGIVGSGVEEPATLVELLGEDASGNRAPTTVPLKNGLKAKSVNCWPSPSFDLGAVNQLFAKMIPAAFYYKTFKWPDWHLFEPSIRRAAGLAGAPHTCPDKRFESRNAHTDLLIVGAGAAGLTAALNAAKSGARVMLLDEGLKPGGRLQDCNAVIDGKPAQEWVEQTTARLKEMPNVTMLTNCTVWAYREHNLLIACERSPENPSLLERGWRIRAKQVIIATGAIERTMVFENNDRPGVMLASAIRSYVNKYAVLPGKRIIFFTNNDSVYPIAREIREAGGKVEAIIDSRAEITSDMREHAGPTLIYANTVVKKVNGSRGASSVELFNTQTEATHVLECDVLGCSGGWNPTTHLFSQSCGTLRFDETIAAFVPDHAAQACRCIGAANGTFGLHSALEEGAEAGLEFAQNFAPAKIEAEQPSAENASYNIQPLWYVPQAGESKSFVDIMNDVTLADIKLAIREGYDNVEHVKRYTTAGMGIDQGKTSNINIIGAIADQRGVTLPDVGTTTFRPPYTPVSFGSISGVREDSTVLPYRHTPVTEWNIAQGAKMYEAGARWQRPGYFPKAGESFQETVNREARAVRENVGVYDGSPLGKFELKGKNVPEFLDLLYTNMMSTLKVGNGRYGIMLSDDGLIMDDGVAFRLDENRWLVSASTGNADLVYRHMEKLLQVERPDWQVMITPVTSQWANATICGPRARYLLEALGTDIAISNEEFPFMALREGHVAGIPARILRVSFTGELSYEINVAPRDLPELWDIIMKTGAPFDITPVGSEANHVLRVEKGFLSLGHEVDGTVDPFDLGMGWIMSKKKEDFLGKRSVEMRRAGVKTRRELVGVLPVDPTRAIPESAPLTPNGAKQRTEGLVTACVYSVANDRWVGLALLENGRERIGQTAHVRLKDDIIPVEITQPVFYDPEGKLLRS